MFGQSWAIYKGVSKIFEVASRACGVSAAEAEENGRAAGMYIGYLSAVVTMDPAGGAGILADSAYSTYKQGEKEDEKRREAEKNNKNPPSPPTP